MNAVRCFNETSKILVGAAIAGGVCGVGAYVTYILPYGTGWLATQAMPALHAAAEGLAASVNPLFIGSFAAVAALVNQIIHPVFKEVIYQRGVNEEAKFIGFILECVVTSGLTLSACWMFGFQITLAAKITMIALYFLAHTLILACNDCRC